LSDVLSGGGINGYVDQSIDIYKMKFDKIIHNIQIIDLALGSDYVNTSFGSSSRSLRENLTQERVKLDNFIQKQIQKQAFLDAQIESLSQKIIDLKAKNSEPKIQEIVVFTKLFNIVNSYILDAPNDYDLDFVLSNEQMLVILKTIRNSISKLIFILEKLQDSVF